MVDKELIKIIEEHAAPFDISDDMDNLSLYHDLDIYGDDVDEFFEKYINTFGVSVSYFCFHDYFPEEGWDTLGDIIAFFKAIFTGKREKEKEYKRITIGDLQRGIDTGKLEL